jgi:thiol-disulfide isomerase/thioredoxin
MATLEKSRITLGRLVFNRYGYVTMATMLWMMLSAMMIVLALNTDLDLSVALASSATLALAAFLLWWQLSPHLRRATPPASSLEALFDDVRAHQKPTLISLESDYCGYCMTIGKRIHQLEREEGLRVVRLSVHTEPGKSLAEQFRLHATPAYLLLDSDAKLLQEWTIALPVERVRYDVRRQTAAYKAVQAD